MTSLFPEQLSPEQMGLRAGLPPINDRMLTTIFLAALFHGIVILGVTFNAPNRGAHGEDAAALEVVLVNDRAPSVAHNRNAHYVSERTQQGSGNTLQMQRTLIPRSSAMALEHRGLAQGDPSVAENSAPQSGEEELLATHAPSMKILYFAAPPAAPEASALPLLLEKRPDLGMRPNDEGIELRLRGAAKSRLWIAADTREADVALYLDGWRRKIEWVGTMNFPDVARRRKLSGTPVIEVTIGADGRLLQTTVRRSSGHVQIDEAAMRILKLAAPYEPFPGALNAKHDAIRIAYEWQFLGGAAQGTRVLYVEPDPASPMP